jgi:hypothetical protein
VAPTGDVVNLDPQPLPAVSYPKVIRGHDVPVGDLDLGGGSMDALVRDLQARLAAEDARLRRLLPAPPWGHEWRGEMSTEEEWTAPFRIDTVYRIRYRLVEIPVGERTYE